MNSPESVLQVEHLTVEYQSEGAPVRAVHDVSFNLKRGEIFGLAGESGCGKSTVAHSIIRILQKSTSITGRVLFNGANVLEMSQPALRDYRWENVSLVMQGAMNSLNPVMTIEQQITDVIRSHRRTSRRDIRATIPRLLTMVGIDPARAHSYPHELSGGMRQRCVIAMALALQPDIVLMDEPTTALDVVVQRAIMDQVSQLCRELGFSVILISHDLDLVAERASRIAVMYAGSIVETGTAEDVVDNPKHPYTRALLNSALSVDTNLDRIAALPGQPPVLNAAPTGCPFFARCPSAQHGFDLSVPRLRETEPGHAVACHLFDQPGISE